MPAENNRYDKHLVRFDAHNRKPGHAKFWKARRNRWGRRKGKRDGKNTVFKYNLGLREGEF